jgi:hypothetical protein
MNNELEVELQAEIAGLEPESRRRVLEYVRALKRTRVGTPESIAAYAGAISKDELQLIQAAIDDGCEQVDVNEW